MDVKTYKAKLKQLSVEIGLLHENYKNLTSIDKVRTADVLEKFQTIEKTLNNVSFAEHDELLKQKKLRVYSELLNNALSVMHQGQFSFQNFIRLPANQSEENYDTPLWLMYSLHYSMRLEKALIVLTLLLAGAPTLIVTILPSLFAIAMQCITPLMILLPPLALSIAVLGGLILGLKITEYVLAKQAEANRTISPDEILKNEQDQSSKKLFEIKRITESLTANTKATFFAGIPKETNSAFDNPTVHFTQPLTA